MWLQLPADNINRKHIKKKLLNVNTLGKTIPWAIGNNNGFYCNVKQMWLQLWADNIDSDHIKWLH